MKPPVAPLPADELLLFLVQVGTLLLLALLLGRLAVRCKLPPVVGELLAGVVLGPSLLGHVAPAAGDWLFPHDAAQIHLLDVVAQLGVLLLVAVTGAHLDLPALRRRRATALRISLCGLLIPLVLGVAAGLVVPASFVPDSSDRWVFAMFIGVAMCVSAIPVISKTLTDMRLLHRDVGQLTLAAGMVDDAVGWFLLAVVVAMATVGLSFGSVALSALALVGFTVVAATLGRYVVRRALRLAARSKENAPTVATVVVIVIFGAAVTHALHLEPIFGAFVVGILIGSPGVVDPRRLEPLRAVVLSVLAPIFLASAGLRMDLTALADPGVALLGVSLLGLAVFGKFAGAFLGARMSRLNRWEAIALGAGMNARGVVEVVVATIGLRIGVLNSESYTIVILIAIATSVMAPPILRWSMSKVEHTVEESQRAAVAGDMPDGVRRPPVSEARA